MDVTFIAWRRIETTSKLKGGSFEILWFLIYDALIFPIQIIKYSNSSGVPRILPLQENFAPTTSNACYDSNMCSQFMIFSTTLFFMFYQIDPNHISLFYMI